MASMVRSHARERVIENWVAVPLTVIVGGTLAYWAMVLDRIPPFDLSEGEIMPKSVKPLQEIKSRWRVTLNRSTPYSATCTREIIDSVDTFHRVGEQELFDTLPPEQHYISRSVIVPPAAAWGPAQYRQTCCYSISGISLTGMFPICVRRPPLQFHIAPDK